VLAVEAVMILAPVRKAPKKMESFSIKIEMIQLKMKSFFAG
jgi:hypothetical protein